ncbi:MAG: transketolase family protein [Candidatus Methanodesulfokora sp.]|jgi:transketolase
MRSFRNELGKALLDAGSMFRNMVVLDVDVCSSTRTDRFAMKFPDRFIQLGISEQDAASTAAGLAISGKIPVLVGFSMFLLRAWEQMRNTISRDCLNVKIIGTHAGLSDHWDGSSHQCLEDIALMRVLPNFTVVCPADAASMRKLLFQMIEIDGPAYMRVGRDNSPEIYSDESELTLGKAEVLADGDDVTLLSCGPTVELCLRAHEELKRNEIGARVLDLHTINPLDEISVLRAARETNGFVVVEEHRRKGGLAGEISEFLSERMPSKIIRIGVDGFGRTAPSYEMLLDFLGLTVKSVVDAAKEVMRN